VFSHGRWFESIGPALAAHDIAAVAPDRRGSGAVPERGPVDDPRAWIDDVRTALDVAAPAGVPRVLIGWCWGARLALAALGAGVQVDRLVLVAPGLVMTEAVKARSAEGMRGTQDPVPLPFDVAQFSADPEWVARIDADPLRWRTQPRSFVLASRWVADEALRVLERLEVPLLTILAEQDLLVDNAAVSRLAARGEVRLLPGGHAVLLERPAEVAALVAGWLEASAGKTPAHDQRGSARTDHD
jgi:alpha-beta hydrolase superfamily lysophospholipase